MADLIHPLRGEIYWVDWTPARGSEQAGTRPGLVISCDALNRNLTVCTVVALTTQIRNSQFAVTLPQSVTGKESTASRSRSDVGPPTPGRNRGRNRGAAESWVTKRVTLCRSAL